eukprot:TRINITY_DN9234_c0_g1_i1.p1 TRINITY_DN9234_c0_g1~~TRINITY_DN9234_c0_g1_i1.p1  ORF type:complete len:300 (-),score=49.80 TRINITY_DN9234_c0_g1_i1:33-896(-)
MKLLYTTLILSLTLGCALSVHLDTHGIGDRLLRTYTMYETLPVTAAEAIHQGWVYNNQTTCNPALGYSANFKGSVATEDYPLTLFFNKAGQISGVGITVYGQLEEKLVLLGYWNKISKDVYTLTVSFRGSEEMCSGVMSPLTIGDRAVINAETISYSIPVQTGQTTQANYTKGSCFYSMGTHYFYDVSAAPNMSWEAQNLMPVVPMYTADGRLNAFFFASTSVQNGFFSAHWWEPVPLINTLMCKNWCDSDCTFSGTSIWSTMHIYLRDIKEATCPGGCSIACCPGK